MGLSLLEREILACKKCESKLAEFGLDTRPIFSGEQGCPVFLLGQAPGRTEYESRKPFQGDAGKSIKRLFDEFGVDDFDKTVYQTSVTKCFPGRLLGASSDRQPSVSEVKNCSRFLNEQLRLLNPKIFVCLGAFAWKAYVRVRDLTEPGYCEREFGTNSLSKLRTPDFVGQIFEWNNMRIIPMIHLAGTANGARAQYPELDRKSKELLMTALQSL